MTKRRIPILTYHRVCDVPQEEDGLPLVVSVRRFDQQMRFLKSIGYQSISLDEAVDALEKATTIPRKSVVITFDDGYKDTYLNAFPTLKNYAFTATVFLVSSLIGCSNEWDAEKGCRRVPLLSLDEICEMKEQGISFGSHSATHSTLTDLSGLELEREIYGSKLDLAKLLGTEIRFFSYPHYRTNEFIQGLVREAGYRGACGGRVLAHNPYNLPRIEIGQDNWLHLWWKVSGWFYRVRRNRALRGVKNRLAPTKPPTGA